MAPPSPLLDRAWEVPSEVAVRPERFGALLYHFGTRRLSFLKDRRLLEVLEHLASTASARQACEAAGVPATELSTYERALTRLADTGMVQERR